jgi:hypothetical protein
MSKNNSREQALILAILIFSGILAIWGLFSWWHYHEENVQKREEAAEHDIGMPHKPINIKCELTSKQTVVCTLEQPDTESTDEHTKSDLKAQQDVAEWSFLSMLFTGAGLVTTIVGLYFIVKSLSVTRQAVELARDTAQKQLRAYVGVRNIEFENGCIHVYAHNNGQTPAFELQHRIAFDVNDTEACDYAAFDFAGELTRDLIPNHKRGFNPGEDGKFAREIDQSFIQGERPIAGKFILIWGRFDYKDVFGNRHHTLFCQRKPGGQVGEYNEMT